MNSCNFVGKLGRDWETTYTQDGKAIAKNSLAVRKFNGDTIWVNLIVFGKRAETVAQYTEKGKSLAVETNFDPSEYEKDGVKKYFTNFIVNNFTLISDGGQQNQNQRPQQNQGYQGNQNQQQPQQGYQPQGNQQGYQNAPMGKPQSGYQQGPQGGSAPHKDDGSNIPF